MIPGKPDYNPSELMRAVKVYPHSGPIDAALLQMLFVWSDANFTTNEKIEKIKDMFRKFNEVSIADALHSLCGLYHTGEVLTGKCDGIDAICYHLDETTIRKTISVLQAALDRFQTWQEADSKKIEESVLKHRG